MNVVEPTDQQTLRPSLAPPPRLETGSIVTLRIRGHTRTQGLEYYAPAVVLNQFIPNGEIEVLIWDSTAGTHYNPSYAIRDLSTRGDGVEREVYEVQSNIGQVLFSPEQFQALLLGFEAMDARMLKFSLDVRQLHERLDKLTGGSHDATPSDSKPASAAKQ